MRFKIFVAAGLALATLFSMTACGNETAEENESVVESVFTTEPPTTEPPTEEETTEPSRVPTVEISSHRLSRDDSWSPVIIVEYEWTNNSTDKECFENSCVCTVTQDDQALASAISGCEDFDSSKSSENKSKLISPGETSKVEIGYALKNDVDDVKIKITDICGENQVFGDIITIS